MPDIDDPGQMPPDQRLSEIAAILARGFLRWRKLAKSAPNPGKSPEIPQNSPKPGPTCLAVPAKTRLIGRAG